MDWGKVLLMVAGVIVLGKIAADPRVSPLWRKIATTAEGDLYQHIITGAIVTVFG